jgi:hypothetical protein
MKDKIFDMEVKAIKYADWVDNFNKEEADQIMDKYRILHLEEVYDKIPGDILVLIEKNQAGISRKI